MPKTEPKPKLVVKDENIHLFEVEVNDNFKLNEQSKEQLEVMDAENAKFEQELIQPLMLSHCDPCQCRMPEIQARIMTRIKLMPNPPPPGAPIQVELMQEDVDAREFGVVVSSENGVYNDVPFLVTRCKKCNTIQLYGQIEGLTYAIASGITQTANRRQVFEMLRAAQSGESDEFKMTDLDTGEETGCNNLGEALFGNKDEKVELGDADAPAGEGRVIQFPGTNPNQEPTPSEE